MIKTIISSWATLALLCCVTSAWSQPVSNAPAPSGPPPRAPDKLYAFSGNWSNDHMVMGVAKKGELPLNAASEALRATLEADHLAGREIPGNEELCIPNGPVMGMTFNLLIFADANQLTAMITRLTRIIEIDKPHTANDLLFDTFSGESVGHWEGDELVVDTIGIKAIGEVDFGIPSSGQMHVIERWKMISPTKLQIKTTVEDPGVLTKPWTFTRHYSRRPAPTAVDMTYSNNYCVSGIDRTRDKKTGKQGYDMTPPVGGYIPPGADK